MAQCKTCGKAYHACPSCGLNNMWEYEYCCEKCWKESPGYKAMIGRMDRILHMHGFFPISVLDDLSEVITACDYSWIFEDMISAEKKKREQESTEEGEKL